MGGPVENLLRAAGCPLYAVPKALGVDVEAQRSAEQREADAERLCVAPCSTRRTTASPTSASSASGAPSTRTTPSRQLRTTHYYLGLRSIVTVYDGGDETTDRLEIDYMVGRIPGSRDVDPMREALLESCADSAAGNQIGALLSCVTLIFALLGTINRMKFSSDANVQKALGLVTDTWGALTLSYTLFNFHANCFDDLPSRFQRLDLDYEWGPGWICYLFCALSDIIRAAAHWVTPTPGNGSVVCTLSLPAEIVKLLDADGDGEITWEDQKLMFKNLKKLIAHETVVVRSRAMLLRADIFEGGGCVMRAASDAAEDLADRVRASLAAHDESPHALGELEKRDFAISVVLPPSSPVALGWDGPSRDSEIPPLSHCSQSAHARPSAPRAMRTSGQSTPGTILAVAETTMVLQCSWIEHFGRFGQDRALWRCCQAAVTLYSLHKRTEHRLVNRLKLSLDL
ncbi:hypothetical protein AURANDRAFT_67699 [Aureococcus anophagefferens]|uniref:EF-hand domain-containing protein n=1 Tax=Aureococcus anophagefferens TaxID=44056 RepID=F0YM37_AURAN|nr:hypothetical protein AURANDRAFT_67699 [Aureococcus anophagefferens]EGB03807.1 hypothetical protein AURANDRAFT_67699 [Aureococcus anophagefferens]|eukprot:XP_009041466.1 hypothetical protein AURANDRAFT_67699 [Aureococcus anophagefferens]